jgi:two-component system cell cycle sensor histidine kinase/response regulator CckA
MPFFVSTPTTEVDTEYLRRLALQSSQDATDVRVANARLRALINIGLELASERDPDLLLQKVCDATRDLFAASYVTLGILDLNDRTVQRVITCGTDAPDWIQAGAPVSGFLRDVVTNGRGVRGENPGGDPSVLNLPPLHPRVYSFLAAPIASPAQVYGWICFVGNDGRAFTEDDEHLVTALSGQVGRVYENGHFRRVAQARADALEKEVTERTLAQEALRQERDRAQRYLDTAQVMLVAVDTTGHVTLVNRYAAAILGWTSAELLGRDFIATCLPACIRNQWKDTLLDLMMQGDLPSGENPVLTRTGEERIVEWRNTVLRDEHDVPVGTFSSGTDVTDARRAVEALRVAETQMRQAQKMEAIGQLAGGVAHDFNNLLTAILGYCELVLIDLEPSDPHRADLEEIQKAGTRAAGLTRQLLMFSRKQLIAPVVLDLNSVVTDMRVLLTRLIEADVPMVLHLAPVLAPITADRGHVEQIVMNLAVNARDAMPAGGTLTISTTAIVLEPGSETARLAVGAGAYSVLTVSDTGTGIAPEVLTRLFEPFFTTKAPGEGTGLGLATVHGIVLGIGGCVDVRTALGRGSSFDVYFPVTEAALTAVPPLAARSRKGAETVLVVDDADGFLELARRLLERHGYTVLVAAGADEALRQFEAHPCIDVLLTDVVMPGDSGIELSRVLCGQRPELKVVYMSGYPAETIARHGILNPGIALLQKPFTSEMLARKIREALDR